MGGELVMAEKMSTEQKSGTNLSLTILIAILTLILTVISTMILNNLSEIKEQSKEIVAEFREYQRKMEGRVSRIEFSIYGDGTPYNRGYLERGTQ